MRSLLIKSGAIIFITLVVGSSLTLAAGSSEPGMFLYPVKQTTQKITNALGGLETTDPPVIRVPLDNTRQQPTATDPDLPGDTQHDVASEPNITETPRVSEATATSTPKQGRTAGNIAATVGPDDNPNTEVDTVDGNNGNPSGNQPAPTYTDGQGEDSQADAQRYDAMDYSRLTSSHNDDQDGDQPESNYNDGLDSGLLTSSHDDEPGNDGSDYDEDKDGREDSEPGRSHDDDSQDDSPDNE